MGEGKWSDYSDVVRKYYSIKYCSKDTIKVTNSWIFFLSHMCKLVSVLFEMWTFIPFIGYTES